MRSFKIVFFLAVIFVFSACGKKDEKVNTENQSSTQNVAPNTQQDQTNSGTVNKKWAGQYTFEESAKNVAGDGAQTWNYVIDIKEKDPGNLIAEIQVDGFQTITRLEASVKASEKNAEVIFEKYGKDNMFELYKKGDRLFTIEANDKGDIITNWDKMKPNVIENQKSGKIMFKKIAS